ncbi:RNA methyltransferase [Luteitalea sp. TBR-22]|uniref:TrmH family RNA methyltransferase n=1 Tax=Luteitalea sp. TBR-22 TaxID=2802971 RepID=UPI001EF60295|nr:RNA methyltransferase [Luteitalea sp. TBR-22]
MDWTVALADPIALRVRGLFLAEGRLVIEGLLASGRGDAIVSVLATPAAAQALALEARLGDRLEIRSPREMEAVTGFNFHRGVLALVRRPETLTVDDVLSMGVSVPPLTCPDRRASATATSGDGVTAASGDGASSSAPGATATSVDGAVAGADVIEGSAVAVGDSRLPTPDSRALLVVLEHLVDVDNIGSCFRNARAFGAVGVLIDDRCADPLYRKAVRTSQGAVLDVPWAAAPIDRILASLARDGVSSIGMTPRGVAGGRAPAPLADVIAGLDPQRPAAVVVGNEGSGLSAEALAACTHLACIRMATGADSINVATALAIALYQITEGSGLRAQGSEGGP